MDIDLRLYALIDPAVPGGRTLIELARRIAGSATLVAVARQACFDKSHGRGGARAARRAGAEQYPASRSTIALTSHWRRKRTVCISGRMIWRLTMRDCYSGRSAIIGLSIKTVEQAKVAPLDFLDYVAIGGVLRHHLQGQYGSAHRH